MRKRLSACSTKCSFCCCRHLQHLAPFLDTCSGSSRSYHLSQDLLKKSALVVVHRAIHLHLLSARKYYYQKRNKPSWVYQSKAHTLIKLFNVCCSCQSCNDSCLCSDSCSGSNGIEVLLSFLTQKNFDWATSPRILPVLEPILMRLCARYVHYWRCSGQYKLSNDLS